MRLRNSRMFRTDKGDKNTMTVVAIHQPNYIPHPALFDKIRNCDIFVFLDSVQYTKNSFINRNRIKTPKGWTWLTIPVHASIKSKICEVTIDNSKQWQKHHWKSLMFNYGSSSHFAKSNFIKGMYEGEWSNLSKFNIALIVLLCHALKIDTPEFVKSSELEVCGKKTRLLLDICKKVGADVYLSGKSGKNYLNVNLFEREGIRVQFQKYKCPFYKQQFGKFIPNLSVIDMLFNVGKLLIGGE